MRKNDANKGNVKLQAACEIPLQPGTKPAPAGSYFGSDNVRGASGGGGDGDTYPFWASVISA